MEAAIEQEPPLKPSALLGVVMKVLTAGAFVVSVTLYVASINTRVSVVDDQLTWIKAGITDLKTRQDQIERNDNDLQRKLDRVIGILETTKRQD